MTIYAETPDSLFHDLEEACHDGIALRERYAVMAQVLRRGVDYKLLDNPLTFSGLFAKIDYLGKQHNIPTFLLQRINDTRKRLTGRQENEETLAELYPHDLKAIVQFLASLYDVLEMPESLARQFPAFDRKISWGKYDMERLRVCVDDWDEHFIYATEAENASSIKVCYGQENRYLSADGNCDNAYLQKILSRHCQLNLVHLRFERIEDEGETVCMPELIIYEPDYLIDISAIAGCFESYADSAFCNILGKLRQREATAPIMLGNFAGQFLDETVRHEKITYQESARRFFKHNALQMTTLDLGKDFHNDAMRQKQIIEDLIGKDLRDSITEYNDHEVVLEPTFFCETLGIQGRMDFLMWHHDKEDTERRNDRVVIIEQKAGKGDGVALTDKAYDAQTPVHQEKHYVQLLLYRAIMNYGHGLSAQQTSEMFLLYSKYEHGLLRLGGAPQLLHKALEIRNQMAWLDESYSKDGMEMLMGMTPDKMNRKGLEGRFWDDYIKRQLTEVMLPLHTASELEKAYFERFMKFLHLEQRLSKIGNKNKENSGFAAKWLSSLAEKREAGNIYDSMTIKEIIMNGDIVSSVVLEVAEGAVLPTTNFRTGDIVVLYPYERGKEPDVCRQMVYRCRIERFSANGLVLRLSSQQSARQLFEHQPQTLWAVEHDMYDSASGALYSGMHSFLTATPERRGLLLMQWEPEIDTSSTLKGDYGKFNNLQLKAKQAKDLFLIIGPPGTGKTSYGMLYLLKEELEEPDTTVLLLSYTNRAVDEICSKLVEDGIDFLRLGPQLSCPEAYHEHLLQNRVGKCNNATEVKEMIQRTRVICATTSSMNGSMQMFKLMSFSLCIIDEASQILEPHLIGLLSARHEAGNAIRKFVMIGDHKQLSAVVQQTMEESAVENEKLREIGLTDCRNSLFERLLSRYGSNEKLSYMLTRQGRMHQDIADFPNKEFYEGKLKVVPLQHQTVVLPLCDTERPAIKDILSSRRVAFINVERPEHIISDKVNNAEAELIAEAVMESYELYKDSFTLDGTVGVIVPYRNQIGAVREAIRRKMTEKNMDDCHLDEITIDTVERYQGSQRDVIIYGFTVQRRYQLNFLSSNTFEENGHLIDRKLNVAMTRAREHLLLVGNAEILRHNITFQHLLDYISERKGVF